MNNGYYQMLLQGMPAGIERDILWVLLEHVGLENAITGDALAEEIREGYKDVKDLRRKIRLAIQNMRNDGMLVCSCAGSAEGRGYFLPKNRKEFDEFILSEIRSKITSLSITMNQMVNSADKVLGRAYQESLI